MKTVSKLHCMAPIKLVLQATGASKQAHKYSMKCAMLESLLVTGGVHGRLEMFHNLWISQPLLYLVLKIPITGDWAVHTLGTISLSHLLA